MTVLHPEAVWADAWATALNVLGPEEGYALAASEGLAVYWILRRQGGEGFEIRTTPEFDPFLAAEERRP